MRKILVVRLRSIGDTVLCTPTLDALRCFLPEAQIDVLLEDWVAPVLHGFDSVSNVLTVSRKNTKSRLKTAWNIRREGYDAAFNLHGGTTATFFVRASGAKYRVGYENYSYSFLYTHTLSSASDFWQKEKTHSAEQQLALAGFVGVPLPTKIASRLNVAPESAASVKQILRERRISTPYAVIHPSAAFASKQWAVENFARVAEFLDLKGIKITAVCAPAESEILARLQNICRAPISGFSDLNLPEITALTNGARIFIGNDSGIAHIAAAVQTPTVVVFGSSNVAHWRPLTNAPNAVVRYEMPCQPCAGYVCERFSSPRCIENVTAENVIENVRKILVESDLSQ